MTKIEHSYTMLKSEDRAVGHIITLRDKQIVIPVEALQREILFRDFPGCNLFLRSLRNNLQIRILGELPPSLDRLHEQLHQVGPGAVRKFWNHLGGMFGVTPRTITEEEMKDRISYRGESFTLVPEMREKKIDPALFHHLSDLLEKLQTQGIERFGQLPFQLEVLCTMDGIGPSKVERFFTQLRKIVKYLAIEEVELIHADRAALLQYYFTQFIKQFEELMEQKRLVKELRIGKRAFEMLNKRYERYCLGERLTFGELAYLYDLTPQRIRQVVKRAIEKLQPLYQLWMDELQTMMHGKMMVDNPCFTGQGFAQYIAIEILEHHGFHLCHGQKFVAKYLKQEVTSLEKMIHKDLQEKYRGKLITPQEIQTYVRAWTEQHYLPSQYVQDLINKYTHVTATGDYVLAKYLKLEIAEMILKQFPEGIKIYQDTHLLCERANALIPDLFSHEREFTSTLMRPDLEDRVYLWGRGKYIHHSHVTVSQDLVAPLMAEIQSALQEKSFITVRLLFQFHQEHLEAQGIPNEYALYEVLRRNTVDDTIDFSKFPYIKQKGMVLGRNRELIKSYIRQKGTAVHVKELKEEFVKDRGWKSFTLESNLSRDEELIQIDFGVYTLLEWYDHITPDVLEPVMDRLDQLLEQVPSLQVKEIFGEMEEYCRRYGIKTHYLLYYILRSQAKDRFHFPRYPHICALDEEDSHE